MQTQTITTYNFSELNEEAKKFALSKYIEIAISDNWYADAFHDAEELGIRISTFDLDRGQKIGGEFVWEHIQVADLIMDNCGETTKLYQLAEVFRKERDTLCDEWQKDEFGSLDNVEELDEKLDELESQFEKSILWQYWVLLRNEYEYLYSDEFLTDHFGNEEYQFTEKGILYNF